MPTARIFQRPKNAMQSGKARTHTWALEFEPAEAKQPDLNANDIEAASKIIAGTARSMGITVEG